MTNFAGKFPPRTLVSLTICIVLLFSHLFAQKKGANEIDITKKWSHPFTVAALDAMALYANEVFVGSEDGKIEAISSSGKKVWSSEFGGNLVSDLVALENGLFFVTSIGPNATQGSEGVKLRCVSRDTGITTWTLPLDNAEEYFLTASSGSIVVSSSSGAIRSVDTKSGATRWTRQIADGLSCEPAFTATSITLATATNQILSVSFASGEIEEIRKVRFDVKAMARTRGAVVVGDERGNLSYYADGAEKPVWNFKAGGEISHIAPSSEGILVASHDDFVYYLAVRNGSRLWKRRLAGRATQIANIIDQYALISSSSYPRLEIVDISSGKVAGQLTLANDGALVSQPVADANGDLFLATSDRVYGYWSKEFVRK
jgi:outer membrane protein assembly factor BamB